VPLCHDCHQGDAGVHGSRSLMKVFKLTELSMLAGTIEVLQNGV